MKHVLFALVTTLLGFSIGATAAWSHGHGKSTAAQCLRILDPDVQTECLECLQRPKHAFDPAADGDARCAPNQHHHH